MAKPRMREKKIPHESGMYNEWWMRNFTHTYFSPDRNYHFRIKKENFITRTTLEMKNSNQILNKFWRVLLKVHIDCSHHIECNYVRKKFGLFISKTNTLHMHLDNIFQKLTLCGRYHFVAHETSEQRENASFSNCHL